MLEKKDVKPTESKNNVKPEAIIGKKTRLAFTTRFILDTGVIDVKSVNDAYVKSGGKDNLSESLYAVRVVKVILEEIGLIETKKTVTINLKKIG